MIMVSGATRGGGLGPYSTEFIQPRWPRRPRPQSTARAAPLRAADPDSIAGPGRRACVNFWTESLPGSISVCEPAGGPNVNSPGASQSTRAVDPLRSAQERRAEAELKWAATIKLV